MVGQRSGGTAKEPDGSNTIPGEIYRADFTINSIIPITQYSLAAEAIKKIKSSVPDANISYIEINDNKVYVEFYDFPAIPWNLVLIAIIAAIAVYGLTVITSSIKWLYDQLPDWAKPGGSILILLAGVGLVAAVVYVAVNSERGGGGGGGDPLAGIGRGIENALGSISRSVDRIGAGADF